MCGLQYDEAQKGNYFIPVDITFMPLVLRFPNQRISESIELEI